MTARFSLKVDNVRSLGKARGHRPRLQLSMRRALSFILLFGFSSLTSHAQQEQVGLRIITVRTEAEATTIRAQLQRGESFEALAREHSVDPSAKDGGYMGLFKLTDLRSEFQRALEGLAPGEVSPVTRVGAQFVLLE